MSKQQVYCWREFVKTYGTVPYQLNRSRYCSARLLSYQRARSDQDFHEKFSNQHFRTVLHSSIYNFVSVSAKFSEHHTVLASKAGSRANRSPRLDPRSYSTMCDHGCMSKKMNQPLHVPDVADEEDRQPEKAIAYINQQLESIMSDKRFELIEFGVAPYYLDVKTDSPTGGKRPSEPSRSLVKQTPENEKNGPWEAVFYIHMPKRTNGVEDPFGGDSIVVALRFNTSYPEYPPGVSVRSSIHHRSVFNTGQAMPLEYYQMLDTPPEGTFPLGLLLEGMIKWLQLPGSSLGGDPHEHTEFKQNILSYKPHVKEPRFFQIRPSDPLPDEWLDPRFLEWKKSGYKDMDQFLRKHEIDIYSFPLFTMEFCDALVTEVRSIYKSGIEVQRPNSMNRYGVILNSIGMEGLMSAIQRTVRATKIAETKFGGVGGLWDAHHSFIVQYAPGKDLGLDMHTDDSDVTANICLGIDFEGSQVAFCGKMGAADHRKKIHIYEQKKGYCLIHLGRQRHGAVDIEKGERMNLIMWNRSRLYRQTDEYRHQVFEKEAEKPDEVCLSYTHDRDYGVYKSYPKGFEHFNGRGWCPPRGAEYAGFVPEN